MPGPTVGMGGENLAATRPTRRTESTTDPESRLYKRADGQPTRLCHLGHALMDNRHGLAVDGRVTLSGVRFARLHPPPA